MGEETIRGMISNNYSDRFEVKEVSKKDTTHRKFWSSIELWDKLGGVVTGRDLILKYLYEGGFMRKDLQDGYDKTIQRTEA